MSMKQAIAPLKRLLTPNEVAQRLGCSRAHVHVLLTGTASSPPVLPFIKVGPKVFRIDPDQLELFLAEQTENRACVRGA